MLINYQDLVYLLHLNNIQAVVEKSSEYKSSTAKLTCVGKISVKAAKNMNIVMIKYIKNIADKINRKK